MYSLPELHTVDSEELFNRLEKILDLATRQLAEPGGSDTATLIEICDIAEGLDADTP
jgi:hypothetical protein